MIEFFTRRVVHKWFHAVHYRVLYFYGLTCQVTISQHCIGLHNVLTKKNVQQKCKTTSFTCIFPFCNLLMKNPQGFRQTVASTMRGWCGSRICTVLHYTTLHCTILHCTALQCTTLHYTALSSGIYFPALHCISQHYNAW